MDILPTRWPDGHARDGLRLIDVRHASRAPTGFPAGAPFALARRTQPRCRAPRQPDYGRERGQPATRPTACDVIVVSPSREAMSASLRSWTLALTSRLFPMSSQAKKRRGSGATVRRRSGPTGVPCARGAQVAHTRAAEVLSSTMGAGIIPPNVTAFCLDNARWNALPGRAARARCGTPENGLRQRFQDADAATRR